MSVDSILREKLFERGTSHYHFYTMNGHNLPDAIFRSLVEANAPFAHRIHSIWPYALRTVTHHGGQPVRLEIAKHANALTRLIEEFPDDKNIAELAITSLSHSVNAALEGDKPVDSKLLASLDMRHVLKVVTKNMRKEWVTPYLVDHAMGLLSMATLHVSDACTGYPLMVKSLVAGLRSKTGLQDVHAWGGIIRMHRSQSEIDEPTLDLPGYMALIQRGFPDQITTFMLNYGLMRCDTYPKIQTYVDYQ
jgi:hypothetical protein